MRQTGSCSSSGVPLLNTKEKKQNYVGRLEHMNKELGTCAPCEVTCYLK